jgi:hypothetical protein
MKTWPIALMTLACLLVGGCRTDPATVLLERENRLLEDEIYRLRGVIEDYKDGLLPISGEIVGCEDGLIIEDTSPVRSRRDRGTSSSSRTRRREGKPRIVVPEVTVPRESVPEGELPDILRRPAGVPAPEPAENTPETELSSPPRFESSSTSPATPPAELELTGAELPLLPDDSRRVAKIRLIGDLTGGLNTDRQSGDEGVQAVLQLFDGKGHPLIAPADVSIAVLDPALPGESARVARWDFPPQTTAEMFCTDGKRVALFLDAPWPEAPPQHQNLHLFVRYITRDGRRLQVDQPIKVALPGEPISSKSPPQPLAGEPAEGASEAFTSAPADEAATGQATSGASRTVPIPRPPRTASRSNAPKLKRPVWSPERR